MSGAFAGFTRRHVVPHRYLAGFRCARAVEGASALRPLTSYRFVLDGCQPDRPAVKVSVTSTGFPVLLT